MYGGENYEGKQEKSKKTESRQSKTFGDWFFGFGDNIVFFCQGSRYSQCGNRWQQPDQYYTSIRIEKGTSLWDIAGDYMTEEYVSQQEYIDEVMQMNHLKSDVIYEGAYLCVPYYSAEQK